MIEVKESYKIIDDNCGKGYEGESEVARTIHEYYQGMSSALTGKEVEGRWYVVQPISRNM